MLSVDNIRRESHAAAQDVFRLPAQDTTRPPQST